MLLYTPDWSNVRLCGHQRYFIVKCPDHPRAWANGYVYAHEVIAEQKLGRLLMPGEVVHHIDGNSLHNDPDNIEVLRSRAEHAAGHIRERRQGAHGYLLPGRPNDAYEESKAAWKASWQPRWERRRKNPPRVCATCGKPTSNKAFCSLACAGVATRKVLRPDRAVLQADLAMMPWTAIGKKYGVTDNAVRRWARAMGLSSSQSRRSSSSVIVI